MADNDIALLSSSGEYSSFTFRDRTIKFLTGKNLERYTKLPPAKRKKIILICCRFWIIYILIQNRF